MTPAEIIAMLASVGVTPDAKRPTTWDGYLDVFSQFAALVAAKEREACAQVADSYIDAEWPGDDLSRQSESTAADIRARGQS
jgi:hypothetical protein